MQRKTTYKCENCGRDFANGIECQKHEKDCRNRLFLIEQLKERLQNYFKVIEQQDFDLSIRYETSTTGKGICLIAILDTRARKKR